MLIYGAIAAFGFLFLVAMLLFGHDHDIGSHDFTLEHDAGDHGGGPSVFSARVMASFLTAFGVGGIVGQYYELSHPSSSGIGTAAGIVLAGIVYQFARILHSQQASSAVRMTDLVGRAATVSVAIPAGGVGQVTLTVGGERNEYIARAADGRAVVRGSEVVITALGGEALVVAPASPAQPGGSA